jgi:tetratricopeptide (TPR) repeat protein
MPKTRRSSSDQRSKQRDDAASNVPVSPDTTSANPTLPSAKSYSGASQLRSDRLSNLIACAGILLLGLTAHLNGLFGDFVLDDKYEIEQNPGMDQLLPPWRPAMAGRVIPARPIPYYTFAIDVAIWGRYPFGFHITNIAIHLSSAMLLFGIVRRTLLMPKLRERYGTHAITLAFFITALWVVHPIQTQAVTYIYQRLESLMSLLFLASCYCFICAYDSEHAVRWRVVSVAFMLLAVMSKESAIAVPPLLFLYDVVFRTDSWTATTKIRYRYFAAMLLTYIPLAILILSQNQKYEEFRETRSAVAYLRSQPIILLRYLQLCFYPTGQCLDYLWQRETDPLRIIGPSILMLGVMAAGIYGLLKLQPWGWLIAAFFLPLLPTSSLIPVNDLANEHRMYLASAAVATAFVLAAFELYRLLVVRTGYTKLAGGAFALAAAAAIVSLGCATNLRNRVYFDRVTMWEDVVAKAPHNTRAFENLASAYLRRGDNGDYKRAAEAGRRILLDPKHQYQGHLNLGNALLHDGDVAGAMEHLTKAIDLRPMQALAFVNLAATVMRTDPKYGVELYLRALKVDPNSVATRVNLADAYARTGDLNQAEAFVREAIEISPNEPRSHQMLAQILNDKQAAARKRRPLTAETSREPAM